ncbi:aminotransferase-like domain-containing protein [Mannheimia haemolytica]
MNHKFSTSLSKSNPSFIREILKLTVAKDMISFAGGLPDPSLFPIDEIKQATLNVFKDNGSDIFQYSTTEGLYTLRKWIADRFTKKNHCAITPEQVLIVSGSQQALDLVGKVFLNSGDKIILESPSYLGAIQAFNLYNASFCEVDMQYDGIDLEKLAYSMKVNSPKFFYGIPNFQNPAGISYSQEKREKLSQILIENDQIMIEDDPYGELNYRDIYNRAIYSLAPENTIYLGSFSKIFAPSFRLGWIIASENIMKKLIIAKQATDLHTNYFSQVILNEYLNKFNIDEHIEKIKYIYSNKKLEMIEAIKKYMNDNVVIYPSDGGMFIWIKIPNISAIDLLPFAIKNKVAFIPGETFSTSGMYKDQMRLNYTNLSIEDIHKGIKNLQKSLIEYQKTLKI